MTDSSGRRHRIAVVGAGVSGLGAAWALAQRHDVTVFEANRYAGGHSNTVTVDYDGHSIPVDTGFIVFNDRNYPNLLRLFAQLQVPSIASDMSFAVSVGDATRRGRLEWAGRSEEHTSELQSLMRISYAVFCLQKKKTN